MRIKGRRLRFTLSIKKIFLIAWASKVWFACFVPSKMIKNSDFVLAILLFLIYLSTLFQDIHTYVELIKNGKNKTPSFNPIK